MGLFVPPHPDGTWEDNVAAAEANLRLLREDDMNPRSEYLLSFAMACLDTAQKKLKALGETPDPE
jgi:hypothetical protein